MKKFKAKKMRAKGKAAQRAAGDLRYTQNRELSWLQFNARVLAEAADEAVPPGERLKFGAIFASNLDEFFRVRVGALAAAAHDKPDSASGWTPSEQLREILDAAEPLCKTRDKAVAAAEKALAPFGYQRLSRKSLTHSEEALVRGWLERTVQPEMNFHHIPLDCKALPPVPHGGKMWVVVRFERSMALAALPDDLPPYLKLPGKGLRFIPTEQILLDYTWELFHEEDPLHTALVRLTRSAETAPETALNDREAAAQMIRTRDTLPIVRLEVRGKLKGRAYDLVREAAGLPGAAVYEQAEPLDLAYIWPLLEELPADCFAPPFTPKPPAGIDPHRPMIEQILEQDRLLHYPYESMEPFLRLLDEAAEDPEVAAISMTAYRVAKNSRVLHSLCKAARNHKKVTVLIELTARFDEENNLEWSRRLEEAGATVLHGPRGCKVHAKLCLIERDAAFITQIGTGNYNEKTAELYTDLSYLTADQVIGADAAVLFSNLAAGEAGGDFDKLLVSPDHLRQGLLERIALEAEKARAGLPSGIAVKCNSLTDRAVIDALQQASAAGVPVRLLVRGICCLVPGVEGLTERIEVSSIVGRFLEHARIYAFGAEREQVFIGSADLMERNLRRRVEVLCPLTGAAADKARHILEIELGDNVSRRRLTPKKGYKPVGREEWETPLRAQAWFMEH